MTTASNSVQQTSQVGNTATVRRFDQWSTYRLSSVKVRGDGTCLIAAIQQEVDEEGEIRYCTTLYRAEYNRYGLLQNHKLIKREILDDPLDAVRYCETVDLGEIITKE